MRVIDPSLVADRALRRLRIALEFPHRRIRILVRACGKRAFIGIIEPGVSSQLPGLQFFRDYQFPIGVNLTGCLAIIGRPAQGRASRLRDHFAIFIKDRCRIDRLDDKIAHLGLFPRAGNKALVGIRERTSAIIHSGGREEKDRGQTLDQIVLPVDICGRKDLRAIPLLRVRIVINERSFRRGHTVKGYQAIGVQVKSTLIQDGLCRYHAVRIRL